MAKKFQLSIQSRVINAQVQTESGRDYYVAEMIPIVGDTVMNRLLYPDDVINYNFMDLDGLPAPDSHPEDMSARDPLAINAHHFGAFVRNPRKEGKTVYAELWIDKEVANRTQRGTAILNALENKQKVGVSVGCWVLARDAESEIYDKIIEDIQYDHVAVLLNEAPAGADTFVLNEKNCEKMFVCNTADAIEHKVTNANIGTVTVNVECEGLDELKEALAKFEHVETGEGNKPTLLHIDESVEQNNKEHETMTHEEMKVALAAEGFTVVDNARLADLEKIEAAKVEALNAKKVALGKLTGIDSSDLASLGESALDAMITNAEEAAKTAEELEALKAKEDEDGEDGEDGGDEAPAPEGEPANNSLRVAGGVGKDKANNSEDIKNLIP